MTIITPEKAELGRATAAVTEALLARGYLLDCVLGARVLTELLTEQADDAQAIATVLSVVPNSVRRDGKPAIGVVVGDAPESEASSTGFNGHVVVRATIGDRTYLLDPTIAQLHRFQPLGRLTENLLVLVSQLTAPWPTPERTSVEYAVDRWTLKYTHAPERDFSTKQGWNPPELCSLLEEARAIDERGPDLELIKRLRPCQRPTCCPRVWPSAVLAGGHEKSSR